MRGAELKRLARRMQRVRQQQQAGGDVGLIGGEHGGLASAVRVAAEEDLAGNFGPQDRNGALNAFSIARRHGRERRAVWTQLAEGQVKAEHQKAGPCKGSSHGGKKLRLAVGAGAVGQRQGVAIRLRRLVEEAANRGSTAGFEYSCTGAMGKARKNCR